MTQCRVIALNPVQAIVETETVGVALSDSRIPLASHSAHGVAITNSDLLTDAPRVLRPGGRIVAPASSELPAGVVEIARDDRDTVGEAPQPVVPLRRG